MEADNDQKSFSRYICNNKTHVCECWNRLDEEPMKKKREFKVSPGRLLGAYSYLLETRPVPCTPTLRAHSPHTTLPAFVIASASPARFKTTPVIATVVVPAAATLSPCASSIAISLRSPTRLRSARLRHISLSYVSPTLSHTTPSPQDIDASRCSGQPSRA